MILSLKKLWIVSFFLKKKKIKTGPTDLNTMQGLIAQVDVNMVRGS